MIINSMGRKSPNHESTSSHEENPFTRIFSLSQGPVLSIFILFVMLRELIINSAVMNVTVLRRSNPHTSYKPSP
jgi:hypothetical protein